MLVSLRCASCSLDHEPAAVERVCRGCGRSLSAEYDLTRLGDAWRDGSLRGRDRSMWRFREALPGPDDPAAAPVSLGEGGTPLVAAPRLAGRLGLAELWIKDEARNPTGSFKDRGMSAALTAAVARGVRVVAAPSAGNAAGSIAAYAARAGIEARVFLPEDCPEPNRLEARLHAARLETVPGTIADAAARMRECQAADDVGFDLSTLKEPYRLDGKKTLGYELVEALDGLPDVIVYPTGGGTGLLGMCKAFDELEQLGVLGRARPRMVAVQAEGCDPIVRAFLSGADESIPSTNPATLSSGLRVPKAFADWWVLRELRRSDGVAVAVSDDETLAAIRDTAAAEGLLLCPEGAATVAAVRRLRESGWLPADARTVAFNTAAAHKYPDALRAALSRS